MRNKKSIAVLLGDPSGIGPELISNIKNELVYLIKTEGYKKVSEVIGKSV